MDTNHTETHDHDHHVDHGSQRDREPHAARRRRKLNKINHKAKKATMNGRHRRGGRGGQRHEHGPGHGHGRRRRGAVGRSLLMLIGEQPMHGYELISELEARTEGRWRPSPGAVYPALGKLEERGLIRSKETADGKQQYEITEAGQERLSAVDPDAPPPWDDAGEGGPSLRAELAELAGPVRQIGRFGTDAQRTSAVAVLGQATRKLYAILAEATPENPAEETES